MNPDKRDLIDNVLAELREEVSEADRDTAEAIALRGLEKVSIEELRMMEGSLRGACLALLGLAQNRMPGEPAVRVWNPENEAGGWDSPHTAITIVTDDMPFLVDSVTSEINRRELRVHVALHPQITILRNKRGKLEGLTLRGSGEAGLVNESLMHFEIDVQTAEVRAEIAAALEEVLHEVQASVRDWAEMRGIMHRVIAEIESDPPPMSREEVAENISFLRWIEDHHFTFLAFVEYRLEEEDDKELMAPIDGTGRGTWRRLPDRVFAHHEIAQNGDKATFARGENLVSMAKSTQRAVVHRPVHMDVITIRKYTSGRLIGEYRFLGLFTSNAYSTRASRIPLIRKKVEHVIERAAFLPASHNAKGFRHIVENYPRDELFQITEDNLFNFALRILGLQLRPRLALLVRRDENDTFISCLLFVPRDRHSTALRLRMEAILEDVFNGEVTNQDSLVSDSPLARVHIIFKVTPGEVPDFDLNEVERRLSEEARTWADRLTEALVNTHGEEEGLAAARRFAEAFPSAYTDNNPIDRAIADIPLVEKVIAEDALGLRLYRAQDAKDTDGPALLHLRTFERHPPATLSDILPRLENMGLKVRTEVPYRVVCAGEKQPVWVRDFRLDETADFDIENLSENFTQTFVRLWHHKIENDRFNRLVPQVGLTWREVVLLRAYGRYLRQVGSAFSLGYTSDTLAGNPTMVRLLVDLFNALFDPNAASEKNAKKLRQQLEDGFDDIQSADEDRILRRYWNLIESTLRTNYFQVDDDGQPKGYLSIKFDGEQVEELPEPRPRFEVYVYSPEMEAVHLRGGLVARGGIRWSDRLEDFRTEILGLVKSQMTKNAVIVPVGAKGGFVVRQPVNGTREEVQAQGIECYKTLMRGLLDLADNLVDGELVHPQRVVRRDGDDPYLVVAADKGTATFSDIANGVSAEYGFWLDDAFASGGSAGYDHKKMGITARGAWESVKRHFREMGRDTQSEPFSVVGVGDMSGDVFGNGMLLSPHIKLIAAFNHLHIFVDPDPDPERSFAERERLFELPRSNWKDYNADVLSQGAEIFDRNAKKVELSSEAQKALGINRAELTPDELIRVILKAPVDLLWFGGIGTYVKATHETHLSAGDRANDDVRIDATQVRAQVIGEGANLGVTQAARVEFAQRGGRLNTDYIDNSGGVDCSDHEVNIKIALAEAVRRGALDEAQRNQLLEEMTDEVARLVLRDNYLQTQAITMLETRSAELFGEHNRLMLDLERAGQLNRRLEGLPDETEVMERREAGKGLTRPELSALLASSKIYVYNELLDSELPDEPQLVEDLVRYFPKEMRKDYREVIEAHRLRREIIATHVTNSMLNRVGPTFVPSMANETGSTPSDIARAYTAARDIFALRDIWRQIEDLDNEVPAELQVTMMQRSIVLVERATRWLLRHAGRPLDLSGFLTRYELHIVVVAAQLQDMLPSASRSRLKRKEKRYVEAGVPQALAEKVTDLEVLHSACDVARCAVLASVAVERVGRVYFAVGERYGIDRLLRAAAALLRSGSQWQAPAVGAIVEDLYGHQADLTQQIVQSDAEKARKAIAEWEKGRQEDVERIRHLLSDFDADSADLAFLSVAERELRRLAVPPS